MKIRVKAETKQAGGEILHLEVNKLIKFGTRRNLHGSGNNPLYDLFIKIAIKLTVDDYRGMSKLLTTYEMFIQHSSLSVSSNR